MLKKLMSFYICFYMALLQFSSITHSYAQNSSSTTIAVLDLSVHGISESEGMSLSDYLRNQFSREISTEKYSQSSKTEFIVVERSQMEKIFDQFDIQSSGCTDVECAVEFGKMLNVESIVLGSVGLVGSTYTLSARIVEVETGKTLTVADYMFTGERDNLLKQGIPNIVNQLLYGRIAPKPSKLKYYVIGGAVILAGAAAVLLNSSQDKKDSTDITTGIINIIGEIPE